MHPSRDELRVYLLKKSPDMVKQAELEAHIESCEFCSELCDEFRRLVETGDSDDRFKLSDKLRQLSHAVWHDAVRGTVIDLKPLTEAGPPTTNSTLAADGGVERDSDSVSFLTLCSEDPEVLVRVMRDPDHGGDYLQLLAEDKDLAAHVMVRLPDLDREYVTDINGRARLDLTDVDDPGQLRWQIKMPDAVFDLEQLQPAPDAVDYAEEIRLETDRHDLIEIRWEGRTDTRRLSIRVLELDGRSDYGPVQVALVREDGSQIQTIKPGRLLDFGPVNSETTISIRLYQ